MGDADRRILRKVGSAGMWSNYNLKGRMEKLPFEAYHVYKLVRRSIFSGLPLVEKIGRIFFMWKALYSCIFRGLYCFLLTYFCIEIVTQKLSYTVDI